jgi:hypothetical protein
LAQNPNFRQSNIRVSEGHSYLFCVFIVVNIQIFTIWAKIWPKKLDCQKLKKRKTYSSTTKVTSFVQNPGSRFGKYIEIHYNKAGYI